MRISSVNTNTSNQQNPNFGMKLVVNRPLLGAIRILKRNGCSQQQITDMFEQLNKNIDDSKTLKFGLTKTNYNSNFSAILSEEIFDTLKNQDFSEKFAIFIRKNATRPEHRIKEFEKDIMDADANLGNVAKSTRNAFMNSIETVFKNDK